jgi:ATP/maltotriose-dependent transcriptional regulator MalT
MKYTFLYLSALLFICYISCKKDAPSADHQNKAKDSLVSVLKNSYRKRDWVAFQKNKRDVLNFASNTNDTTLFARTLEYVAAYYRINNNVDSTSHYYNNALKLYEATNDSINIGFTLLNLAIIQKNLRNYPASTSICKRALLYLKDKASNRRVSSVYNTIGINYNNQKQYDLALDYHYKALGLRKTIDNPKYLIQSLNNIGMVYKRMGNYPKALEYFNQMYAYDSILVTFPKTHAALLDNMAHTKFLCRYNTDNESPMLTALHIRNSINDKYGVAINSIHLSEYYRYNGDIDRAIDYATRAETMARSVSNNRDKIASLELLVNLLDGSEKQRVFRDYTNLRDSLDLADNKKLDNLYKLEQKAKTSKLEITRYQKIIKREQLFTYLLYAILIVVAVVFTVFLYNKRKKSRLMNAKLKQLELDFFEVKKKLDKKHSDEQEHIRRIKESKSFKEYLEKELGLKEKGYKLLELMYEGKTQIEQASELEMSVNTLKWFKRVKFYPQLNIGWDIVHKQQEAANMYRKKMEEYKEHIGSK